MSDTNVRQGSHIPISFGYVAKGQAALLKAQKADMKLQETERKNAIKSLQIQHESNEANAEGIVKSAEAEAQTDMMDAVNYGVQAGTNAAQIGHTMYLQSKQKQELDDVSRREGDADAFKEEFNKAEPAGKSLSNAEREQQPKMTPQQEARFQELANGEGKLQLQNGDKEILKHIKADERARRALSRHINKTKESLTQEKNTIVTQFQATFTMMGLYYTLFQNAGQSATAGVKMEFARDRGYGQATSALAQNAEQNANTSINQFMQEADAYDQHALQINRAREALAGNGQG